jgi:hypothetical protein
MLISAHLEKVDRLDAARRRLDPFDDYELWYFAALTGCVNAMNAALHALGATVGEDCFAYNVPVYFRPGDQAGSFEPVIRPFGDIEHIDGPETEALVPLELTAAKQALIWLEEIRDPSVRGNLEITQELIDQVEAAYGTCLQVAHEAVARAQGRAS